MAQHLDAVLPPKNAYFVQKEWQFYSTEQFSELLDIIM
jgi:hypothetical protein